MRTVKTLLLAFAVAAFFTACNTIPGWVVNPPSADDAYFGVGSAKSSSFDNSMRIATERARSDIAAQVESKIKQSLVDYFQEAGVDGKTQVTNFVESITKQTVEQTLTESKTSKREQSGDGTVYVQVTMPKKSVLEKAKETFTRNEDASFAEFKASEALKKLEAGL